MTKLRRASSDRRVKGPCDAGGEPLRFVVETFATATQEMPDSPGPDAKKLRIQSRAYIFRRLGDVFRAWNYGPRAGGHLRGLGLVYLGHSNHLSSMFHHESCADVVAASSDNPMSSMLQ